MNLKKKALAGLTALVPQRFEYRPLNGDDVVFVKTKKLLRASLLCPERSPPLGAERFEYHPLHGDDVVFV